MAGIVAAVSFTYSPGAQATPAGVPATRDSGIDEYNRDYAVRRSASRRSFPVRQFRSSTGARILGTRAQVPRGAGERLVSGG